MRELAGAHDIAEVGKIRRICGIQFYGMEIFKETTLFLQLDIFALVGCLLLCTLPFY